MSITKNLFVHLRVHSIYSLSEGMLSFDYLSNFCIDKNQPAMAITDTSSMFGVLEFSLKMVSAGIQPIIGMQVNIAERAESKVNVGEVVLIAKNEIGYKNLLILASDLSLNDNFEKYLSYSNLEKFKDGLILLTGGVENGFIGQPAAQGNKNKVYNRLKDLEGLFKDNLYIELQRHGLIAENTAEKILLDLSEKLNIKYLENLDTFTINLFFNNCSNFEGILNLKFLFFIITFCIFFC